MSCCRRALYVACVTPPLRTIAASPIILIAFAPSAIAQSICGRIQPDQSHSVQYALGEGAPGLLVRFTPFTLPAKLTAALTPPLSFAKLLLPACSAAVSIGAANTPPATVPRNFRRSITESPRL